MNGGMREWTWRAAASGLHDEASMAAAAGPYGEALRAMGGRPAAAGERPDAYFALTGGTEQGILAEWERWGKGRALVLAHPGHNSLPAALEAVAGMRLRGGEGKIVFWRGAGDGRAAAATRLSLRAKRAAEELSASRFGRIGESSDWLVASATAPEAVEKRYGCRVEAVGMEEWREAAAAEKMPSAGDGPEWRAWNGAKGKTGVDERIFADSVRLARGLRAVAARRGLNGVTVRCFDILKLDGVTGCLALALLADEGVASACEGDMASLVSLRWTELLTGRPGWMANPHEIDAETGQAGLSHCTVPLSCVEEWSLKSHFESGIGLAIDGTWAAGPATLLRLGGKELEDWWGAEGVIEGASHEDGRCRTQIRVQLREVRAAEEWLSRPLGNHVTVARGWWKEAFEESRAWLAGTRGWEE